MRIFITIAAGAWLLATACGPGVAETRLPSISAVQLAQRIDAGRPPFMLDVRSREEFRQGRIPGAVNIPYDDLAGRLDELPAARSDEIVIYCRSGRRAQLAAAVLRDGGYSNVRDLDDHWRGWQAAELPAQ